MSAVLPVIGSTDPWFGGAVSEFAYCVLAPNPSIMTLDGTNTWVLGDPDSQQVIVIDPGPADEAHWAAVERVVEEREARAVAILLTHGHADHSEGAAELAARLGCGVRALDPRHRLGSEGLVGGDVVAAAGIELRVISTPGHTADSLSFHFAPDNALLTGDTVLGRGTTVVAHPDGRLREYLASLQELKELAERTSAVTVLPGHGPALPDPVDLLDAYLWHRQARLDQVRAARIAGAESPEDVVAMVYADVPTAVLPAALLSVRAQWEYLEED